MLSDELTDEQLERAIEIGAKAGEAHLQGAVEVDWSAAAKDLPLPEAVLARGHAPLVPVGEIGLLAGFGGGGKSRLVAQMAAAAAGAEDGELVPVLHPCTASTGRPGMGDALRVRGGPVVLAGYEDAAPWVRWRTAAAAKWLDGGGSGGRCAAAVDDLERLSAAVLEGPLFAPAGGDLAAAPTPAWHAVFNRASEIGAGLVIVDPLSLAWDAGAEGYQHGPVNRCVAALRAEAVRLQAAVVLVAHLPKTARWKTTSDAGDVSGSAAWVDRVRGVLMLTRREDKAQAAAEGRPTYRPLLTVSKSNYCASSDTEGWELEQVVDDAGRPLAWEVKDGEAQEHGGGVVPITVA